MGHQVEQGGQTPMNIVMITRPMVSLRLNRPISNPSSLVTPLTASSEVKNGRAWRSTTKPTDDRTIGRPNDDRGRDESDAGRGPGATTAIDCTSRRRWSHGLPPSVQQSTTSSTVTHRKGRVAQSESEASRAICLLGCCLPVEGRTAVFYGVEQRESIDRAVGVLAATAATEVLDLLRAGSHDRGARGPHRRPPLLDSLCSTATARPSARPILSGRWTSCGRLSATRESTESETGRRSSPETPLVLKLSTASSSRAWRCSRPPSTHFTVPGITPTSSPRSRTSPSSSSASTSLRRPPPCMARAPITEMINSVINLVAVVDHLRDGLGDPAFDNCVSIGRSMESGDAVHYRAIRST